MTTETITTNMRHYNKWSVNEVLTLQREYELLELSLDEIATRHKRSTRSILFKLQSEGFIGSWEEARGFNSHSHSYYNDTVTEDILTPSLSDTSEGEEEKEITNCQSNISNQDNNLTTLTDKVSLLENKLNNLTTLLDKLLTQQGGNQINLVLA